MLPKIGYSCFQNSTQELSDFWSFLYSFIS